jgi:dTDP-4-amino-4,6-dideoxygalactose transaminase
MIERQELELLKENGYVFNDPFDVITMFEKKISDYTGARYVTVTDCCTHSLELCLRYRLLQGQKIDKIILPKKTYLSVPMMCHKLGIAIEWSDETWKGFYHLKPTNVIDMALRFTKDCYVPGSDSCLSFGNKKVLKVNRGGAILTDDKDAHDYYQLARYDGRDLSNRPWELQKSFDVIGYHYNLSCEDCARGILLMDDLARTGLYNKDASEDIQDYYPDLSKLNIKTGT